MAPPPKRTQTRDRFVTERHWFPWKDKIVSSSCAHEPMSLIHILYISQTCTLDILMHLPRSVFSHRQLDLFLWLLKVNDVDDVPSVKSIQALNALLQGLYGIDSIPYKGALGHNYFVNSLAQIIAQVCHTCLYDVNFDTLLSVF